MSTTTIRVDLDTHAQLLDMSRVSGRSLVETVREATEALRRQRFAQQVGDELARLGQDEQAWASYMAEADETSVNDGLGR